MWGVAGVGEAGRSLFCGQGIFTVITGRLVDVAAVEVGLAVKMLARVAREWGNDVVDAGAPLLLVERERGSVEVIAVVAAGCLLGRGLECVLGCVVEGSVRWVGVWVLEALDQAAVAATLEHLDGCFDAEVGLWAVGGTVLEWLEGGFVFTGVIVSGASAATAAVVVGGLEGTQWAWVEVEGLGGVLGRRESVVVVVVVFGLVVVVVVLVCGGGGGGGRGAGGQ